MSNSEFTSDRFKFKRALEQPQGALQNFVIIDGDFIEPRELTVSNLAVDAIDLAYGVDLATL